MANRLDRHLLRKQFTADTGTAYPLCQDPEKLEYSEISDEVIDINVFYGVMEYIEWLECVAIERYKQVVNK